MNTILTTEVTTQASATSGVKRGAAAVSVTDIASAKRQDLPVDGEALPSSQSAESKSELSNVVEEINKHIQNMSRDLQFSVDEDAGRVVVKVLDSETGDLIRQIPSEEALRIAESISENVGVLFEAQA